MQKRASDSSSSGQPSQPKKSCFAPINQEWNGSERKLEPRSCLMQEDVRRVSGEKLEPAESHWADYCQSCTGNALNDMVKLMHDMVKRMQSLEISVQELKEAVEHPNIHSPHLARANAKSMAKNDARNLQLQFRTKLSLPLFTGKKLEGEGGACIEVALIDAKTGGVVTSGPESSIKLDVVVLEGDFNKDDEDNWIQEEFESYVVKERKEKRPLLIGNLLVTLKEGAGKLGELTFTDNSSWNRSKSFRIGLKLTSGYCGSTRIREAKTDAFPVKEHRGESYMKHHPPVSDDEVWRLEKIAKDGKSHQKLSQAGIHKVEDFLLQLFMDSKKLREILGKSIIPKNWEFLVDHAKTCKTNWKLYYTDGMRKHGAVFNTNCQLIALIKDGECFATHRLSTQDKELGDTIVKEACDNWNGVREFNGETFCGSVQKKSSSSSPSQVFGGQIKNHTPVQHKLAPRICAAPVGPQTPQANMGSTAEAYTGVTALTPRIYATPVGLEAPPANVGSAAEVLSPGYTGATPLVPRICAAPIGPEAPPTHVGSNAEGCTGVTALALPGQSEDTNFVNALDFSDVDMEEIFHLVEHQPTNANSLNVQSSIIGMPLQSHDNNFQCQMIESWSQMDYTEDENVLSFEPPHGSTSSIHISSTLPLPEGNDEDFQSAFSDDCFEHWLARFIQNLPDDYVFCQTPPDDYVFIETPPDDDVFIETPPYVYEDRFFQTPPDDDIATPYYDTFFETPPYDDGHVRSISVMVNGWLKIEAVMQWGFAIRRRGVRIVQLDELPN